MLLMHCRVCNDFLPFREQLEFLEDKLREFRFLGSADEEHKVGRAEDHNLCDRGLNGKDLAPSLLQAVTLAQLDGVRRELESVVRQQAPYVVLAKVRRWCLAMLYSCRNAKHSLHELAE